MDLLRVLTRPNLGGPTVQALALHEPLARQGVRTLLALGTAGPEEQVLDPSTHGLERIDFERACRDPQATGYCVVPGLGRGLSPGRDLRALLALRRLIRGRRPDLVHTHTSKAGALGRLASITSGHRSVRVHTFHGLVLRDYASGVVSTGARLLEKVLATRTDLCVTVSASCARELRELGVCQDAKVFGPAVPRPQRSSVESRGAAEGGPLLLFVGRLAPIKRIEHFVRLLEQPRLRALGARGLVLGDGPEDVYLRGDRAFLTHRRRSDDVAAELRHADLLVLPSKREGLPLVGVEAALEGVPTLGYAVPGLTDLVERSGLGRVVPEECGIEGLAEVAVELLAAGRPGRADQAFVDETDPEQVASELAMTYRGLLERRVDE